MSLKESIKEVKRVRLSQDKEWCELDAIERHHLEMYKRYKKEREEYENNN